VLDFWQAEGDGLRPLLVYIHGGGWTGGDKKYEPISFIGAGTLNINNQLTSGGGTVNAAAGVIGGSGTIGGGLTNSGATVAPGNSPGILTIDGNYTQTAGTLALEIGGLMPGEEHDKLVVLGHRRSGGNRRGGVDRWL